MRDSPVHVQMYMLCEHTHNEHTLNGFLLEALVRTEQRAVWSSPALAGLSERLRGEQTSCVQTEGSTRHNMHEI